MGIKDVDGIRDRLDDHKEDLTAEEIDNIAHSKHVTAEQLNLLAAHTRHITREREQEAKDLGDLLDRIEDRIKEIEARVGKSSS